MMRFLYYYNVRLSPDSPPVSMEMMRGTCADLQLERARRDSDRQPITTLGFSFSAWNGANASFSATIGCWSTYVRNATVLSIGDGEPLMTETYRVLIEEMVRAFDPDHAVVTSHEHLRRTGATMPWESGLFTYTRGGAVEEHTDFHGK